MPAGVHVAGTPCPGEPNYVFGRSTDDYVIWCFKGTHAYLPGGVTVTSLPQPVWTLYRP
jgi:hypothetical protein